jgi:hypothetical protein
MVGPLGLLSHVLTKTLKQTNAWMNHFVYYCVTIPWK